MKPTIDVDSFAGGGGASLGIERALGKPVDIAINHDAEALAMHRANHPLTRHFRRDIWQVDPADVAGKAGIRLAWFSPDCTHHSRAKGAPPIRSDGRRSRDLAWVVVEWAQRARPNVIMLENVEEYADWGPLLPTGKPCPRRKGRTFRAWVRRLQGAGYRVDWRPLRACDYGTPTTRRRLFLVARRDGEPIRWPEPTHGPGLRPYRTAAECIDWSIPAPSIFLSAEEARKLGCRRPLAEATMRRIARGVYRYVLGDAEPFIVPLTHQGGDRVHSVREPLRTVTTARRGEMALVSAFLAQHNTGAVGHEANEPVSTIVQRGCTQGLVTAHLSRQFGNSTGQPADEPAPTVTAGGGGKTALVTACLSYQGGDHVDDLREPASTVTAGGVHHAIVEARLSGNGHGAAAAAAADRRERVAAFLVKYYGTGVARGLDRPMPTATTRDRIGLVTVRGAEWRIVDIGMRMLTPRELFTAQGFPPSYAIDVEADGRPLSKTAQVRMCGNSVCPQAAEALVRANVVESASRPRPWQAPQDAPAPVKGLAAA